MLLFLLVPHIHRFIKHHPQRFHCTSSRCDELRKKQFRTSARVGEWRVSFVVTYSFCPCVPPNHRAYTSSATIALHVSKNRCISRPLLSSICVGMFCAFLSQELLHVLRLPLGAAILCSSMLLASRLNQVRKKIFTTKAKNCPQISIQFAHKIVTLVKLCQRIDVTSKLLCPWSGRKSQHPIARHAGVFVQASLSNDYRQHLLGQIVFWSLLCHSCGPALAQSQAFDGTLSSMFCYFFASVSPCLCRRLCKFTVASFQREEPHSL